MLFKSSATVAAVSLVLAWAGPALAQHHHHHEGVATHRQGFRLFNPHGHVVNEHHDQYRYVAPPTAHHGAFYTHEDVHYYTPPVSRVVVGPVAAPPPRPVPMEFGSFKHFEVLAERLDSLTNQLCVDLHHNYQHNRNYDETYREAYQVMQAAKFIHGSEHAGDREAIGRSATSLDNLFHHVQGELANWSSANVRRVGQYSLAAKLEEMEALIHHLMYDVGVKPDHDQPGIAPPPGAGPDVEIAPPPRAPAPRP
jgi:hypothetical protein